MQTFRLQVSTSPCIIENLKRETVKRETGNWKLVLRYEREFQKIIELNPVLNCARHYRIVWRHEDTGAADPRGLAGVVWRWSDIAQWPELTRGAKIDLCH